jgi:hypothetical protein
MYENTYTSDQVRSVILKYLYAECAGITIREGGGVYFVPESKSNELAKLKTLFGLLAAERKENATETAMDTVPIVNREESAKAMWRAFTADVNGEMGALMKEIDEMDDKTQNRAKERKISQLKDLQGKVVMYEELLNQAATTLTENLKELEQIVWNKISK